MSSCLLYFRIIFFSLFKASEFNNCRIFVSCNFSTLYLLLYCLRGGCVLISCNLIVSNPDHSRGEFLSCLTKLTQKSMQRLKSFLSLFLQKNKGNHGARICLGNLALDIWLPVCPIELFAESARIEQQQPRSEWITVCTKTVRSTKIQTK